MARGLTLGMIAVSLFLGAVGERPHAIPPALAFLCLVAWLERRARAGATGSEAGRP